jgi:hypothetical protein
MAKAKSTQAAEAHCPQCDEPARLVPPPTDAQRAAAANRDNPVPLSPLVDGAAVAQLAELGPLYRCVPCAYQFRITPARAGGAGSSTGD